MSVREMKMESVGGLIDGIRRGETTARAGVASALEAADKPQRQGDLGRRRQRRMAAGEDQAQAVVVQGGHVVALFVLGSLSDHLLRFVLFISLFRSSRRNGFNRK